MALMHRELYPNSCYVYSSIWVKLNEDYSDLGGFVYRRKSWFLLSLTLRLLVESQLVKRQ